MTTNVYESAKKALAEIVYQAYKKAADAGSLPVAELPLPAVEVPKEAANGDLSSTFALTAARALKLSPRAIAAIVVENMEPHCYFNSYKAAGPGFINATFSPAWYSEVLACAEMMGENYGADDMGRGESVMVEFVSANPTGPMHVGNARGGVLGDSLAAMLERAGYKVWREFYVNDAGNQVDLFGRSIEARYLQIFHGEDAAQIPENGYHGDDIKGLAEKFAELHGKKYLDADSETRRAEMIKFGLEYNIERMKEDLARYRVNYDCWFLESSLHESGYVAETIELLKQKGMLYEKDGALWLKGTEFGMEKDEVLVKSNGFYTYYAVDIAYHRNKFEKRGFDRVIDVLGADHHGHTVRFKAGMAALGIDPSRLEFVLMQLVRLLQNGEVVKMSKRTGKMISLSNLLDEISVDAARFFFNSRVSDSSLDFDIDLAIKQNSENPVYYVQYAHARICTMLSKFAAEGISPKSCAELNLNSLDTPEECLLIKTIARLPGEIRLAARDRDPSRMTKYLTDLASAFHTFYNAHHIKGADEPYLSARLKLAQITKDVLKNVLDLLKITAPEQM